MSIPDDIDIKKKNLRSNITNIKFNKVNHLDNDIEEVLNTKYVMRGRIGASQELALDLDNQRHHSNNETSIFQNSLTCH